MRIAIIHTRLLRRGGLESRLLNYIRYFHAHGHEVSVYVFKVDPAVEVPPGVAVHKVPMGLWPKPLRPTIFDRKLRRLLPDAGYDLILSLGRTSCQDAMVVAGVHRSFLKAMGRKPRRLTDWLQIRLDRRSYATSGVLLAASDMIRQQLMEDHGVSPDRIQVLPPPTDASRFHAGLKRDQAALKARFGLDPNKKSLLFVSANHGLKGLPILMEAIGQLGRNDLELVVAGGKPVPDAPEWLRYLGQVQDMPELYAAGDLTLLASRYDSFGQVVTESLLAGTPVVVSHMVGAAGIVEPHSGIVVPSFEPGDWAEALKRALTTDFEVDPGFYDRFGLSLEAHMQAILACAGARSGPGR